MLRWLTNLIQSLNVKIIILAAFLSIILIILVVKALMIRQKKIKWLQELNRKLTPIEAEDFSVTFKYLDINPPIASDIVSADESTPVPVGIEDEDTTRSGEAIGFDQPGLERILVSFTDYNPEKRREAEESLYKYFETLTRECARLESSGETSRVSMLLEGFFEKVHRFDYPYRFERTEARDQFISRLSSDWSKLPYLSRWAYIRMMGIVDGEDVQETLRSAIQEGIFEDEAAIAILKTGDIKSLPVLVDNISRGLIKGKRFTEVKEIIIKRNDPAVVEGLLAFLANPDSRMRMAALTLLERFSIRSKLAPQDSNPDDKNLKQKWEEWWSSVRSYYNPLMEEEERISAFTLITGTNLLIEDGHMGRGYFRTLESGIENCCRGLRSIELPTHREGELALYRLGRQMVDDYDSGNENARKVIDQYIEAFIREVKKICLYQKFPASKERKEFIRWSLTGALNQNNVPVLVSTISILGLAGERETISVLRPYSESWVPDVRKAAIISMGRLGSPKAADMLGKMLQNADLSPSEGSQLVMALERIGNREAAKKLVRAVHAAPSIIAYEALLSLQKMRGKWERSYSLEEFEQERKVLADDYAAWVESEAMRGLTRNIYE